MISAIDYQTVNGTSQTIRYIYNDDKQLTSVQVGDLPGTRYAYGTVPRSAGVNWDNVPNPTVITSITSALGSVISYTYDYAWAYKDNIRQAAETGVVVVSKTIRAGTETYTYGYTYPKRTDIPSAIWYDASFVAQYADSPDTQSRYFSNVRIDNPAPLEDVVSAFTNSLPTKVVRGNSETHTLWDFDTQRQVKTTEYVSGIQRSQKRVLSWDNYGNPLQTVTQKGSVDWIKEEIVYSTDPALLSQNIFARPIQISRYPVSNPSLKRVQRTVYNDKGKPVEFYEGSPGRILKTVVYDAYGQIVQERVPASFGEQIVNTSYQETATRIVVTNSKSGKTVISEMSKNTGQLLKETDANGAVTTYTYDDYGRPVGVTGPNGASKTFLYSIDLKTTTTIAGGLTSRQRVDVLGRVLWVDSPSGREDIQYTYYHGDAVASVISGEVVGDVMTNAKVRKTYTYDNKLRTLSETTDFGTVRYSYDEINRRSRVTDPKGRYTETTSDEVGNVQTQYSSADGTTMTYGYNEFGEMIQTTDPRGLIHRQDLDIYGRLVRGYHTATTLAGLVQRSVPTYYAAYPDMLQKMTMYSPTGQVAATYEAVYDTEGRTVGLKYNNVLVETHGYDSGTNGIGRLYSSETPDAKTVYTYDIMGRVIQSGVTVKKGGLNTTMTTSQGYDITNGKPTHIGFGDGTEIRYSYHPTTQKMSQLSYNNSPIATYVYNANGTVQKIQLGNGMVLQYAYEKESLLSSILVTNTANVVVYQQSYSYDAQGLMGKTEHNDYVRNNGNLKREYAYSATDQLQQTRVSFTPTVPGQNALNFQYDYGFDANGNPKKFETPRMRNITAPHISIDNNADKILVRANPEVNEEERYGYDGEGNLIRKEVVNNATATTRKTTTYGYNHQGQISEIQVDGKAVGRYGYDSQRQRVYREVPEEMETYLYQWDFSGHIIAEYGVGKPNKTVKYLYSGNAKIGMVRRDSAGTEYVYYFINNAQGTPVLIVDQQGRIVSRINLDEWGNPNPVMNADAREINYTGKKLDPESGLYYFNQRYYDPSVGRFVTEDPAQQAFNPYLYAGNNPMMYVDPNGEWFFTAMLSCFGPLGSMLGAAIDGGMTSAAINAGVQLATTGQINWQSVGNSFTSGALSAGMSFGVGEMMQHATTGLGKTLAHGISGGVSSMASGGNFGSGFVGGAVGNMAGEASRGVGLLENAGIAGLAGGVTSMASGGDFANGFQSGAYNVLYNHYGGGGMNMAKNFLGEKFSEFSGQLSRAWDAYRPNQVSVLHFNFSDINADGYKMDIMALPDVGFGRTIKGWGGPSAYGANVSLPKLPISGDFGFNSGGGFAFSYGYNVGIAPINVPLVKGNKRFRWPWR